MLRGSTWSFVAVVQDRWKRESVFFGNAKKYYDELHTSKAGVSFELFCLQCASDKVIWLLVFLARCLLSTPCARPHSIPV